MGCNADQLIESLVQSQREHPHAICHARADARRSAFKTDPVVVTISRSFGAMGSAIAQRLAERLGLHCCDGFILQEVARRANVDESLVKLLDEHVSIIDGYYGKSDVHWWQRLIKRCNFTHEDYQEYLAKTVLSVSLHGGVIIGRGANFILGPESAFRVRVIGSADKCAARVAEREGISVDRAAEKVCDIDNERSEYIHKLYDADIDQPLFYDLMINTDRFNRTQAVELILAALRQAGYQLPAGAFETAATQA